MSSYLIIADGDFLEKEILLFHAKGKIIVALDGAANKLKPLQIIPNVILGDLDAIDPTVKKYFEAVHQTEIIFCPDQNKTDLVKAIQYCDEQGATEIHVICALGGRIDHDEGNKRALRKEYKPHRPILLYSRKQQIRFLKNERVLISGNPGDLVSILSYPYAVLTTHGLAYETDGLILDFGYDSICNSLDKPSATIKIQGEALLITQTNHY